MSRVEQVDYTQVDGVHTFVNSAQLKEKIEEFLRMQFLLSTGREAIVPRKVVHDWIRQSDVAERYVQHSAYYQREFGTLPDGHKSEVTLTRSGVSAVELAVKTAVATVINPDTDLAVYKHPGWYPENAVQLRDELVASVDDANILLINHEPNYTQREGLAAYEKERDEIIEIFIQRARQAPDRRFAFVYDKTTNLEAKDLFDGDIPENLTYIEAASLTKHSRGQKHAFYGAIWNYDHSVKVSESDVVVCGAEPTNYTIATFPHITKEEHVRMRQMFEDVYAEVNHYLEDMEDGSLGFTLEPYHYYCFVRPPYEVIFDEFMSSHSFPDDFDDMDIYAQRTYINRNFRKHIENDYPLVHQVGDSVRAWAELHPNEVEEGDSFGLEKIRLTVFTQYLEFEYDGKNYPALLEIPRISLGLGLDQSISVDVIISLFRDYLSENSTDEVGNVD